MIFKMFFCVCTAGCRQLQDLEVAHVEVDPCGDGQSAAEGAVLGLFKYDEHKTKKKVRVTTQPYGRYIKHRSLNIRKLIAWFIIKPHQLSPSG